MNTSFAQNTNYYVLFGLEEFKDIKYYLKKCNLPGFVIEPEKINNKVRNIYIQGGTVDFNSLNISVIINESFDIYLKFIDFMQKNKNTELGTINANPFTAVLFITSNKGNPILKAEFEDCVINSISDVELNDASTETVALTFDIVLKYSNIKYTKLT